MVLPVGKRGHDPVDDLVRPWIAVTQADEPKAFAAWADFRRDVLGARFVPKAFTVPSLLPPTDRAGITAYIEAVKTIRASVGWKTTKRGEAA